ncbi:hypothetical protein DA06_021085 [Georgenia sp. SUBG003]
MSRSAGLLVAELDVAVEDEFFVVVPWLPPSTMRATTWGWIHMGLGALVLLGRRRGPARGRPGAGSSASCWRCSARSPTSCSIPYYPLWSLAIIALDILVIWALATAPMTPRTSN